MGNEEQDVVDGPASVVSVVVEGVGIAESSEDGRVWTGEDDTGVDTETWLFKGISSVKAGCESSDSTLSAMGFVEVR